jgi:hypothetical protein
MGAGKEGGVKKKKEPRMSSRNAVATSTEERRLLFERGQELRFGPVCNANEICSGNVEQVVKYMCLKFKERSRLKIQTWDCHCETCM